MTEAEARAALAAFDGLGGLERWIAAQRSWQEVSGGWTYRSASIDWHLLNCKRRVEALLRAA